MFVAVLQGPQGHANQIRLKSVFVAVLEGLQGHAHCLRLTFVFVAVLQGLQGHAHRIKQSSAAQQSQMLNIDFQSIVAALQAGSYQSQEVVKQDIQEICRAAAEAYSREDQV